MSDPRPRRPWDRTLPEERDYFDVLGDGLVAYVPARPEGAGAGGWSPPTGGAWVHLGPDGRIRAFTGKAEVGQGTRTALSLGVAEELRVPLERVELVMADTDLCPWDLGTFGSRSMPDALPALRGAAAGARERLLELAAGRGPVPPKAGTREVRPPGGTLGFPFGELLRGRRDLVKVGPAPPLTPAAEWTVAGRPTVESGAREVVTGRRTYASDVRRPGMLFGAVLHPPSARARLRDAELGPSPAGGGVRLVKEGDFIGAVGPTPRAAREALRTVRARWDEAKLPGEAEIEAYLRSHPLKGDDWDTDEKAVGDPERAIASAAARVEATYRTAYIAHVPLEPRAATAEWDGARLTVWVGTQTPFRARAFVAKGLGLPEDDVRVIVPFTGAGFGGKHGGDVALAAARLARAAVAPVQVAFSREEEFRFGYFRPMAIMDVRASADADGRLTGWVFHNVNAGAAALFPPYRIPNQRVDNELSDSPLAQGAYRSLAANTNNFARESAVDELARELGIDPVAFRERNLEDERLLTVLRRATEAAGWERWSGGGGRGHGVAVGLEKGGRVATVAHVRVGEDRSLRVERLVTAFEAGAVVHPSNLASQAEGAAVQAIGGALFEAVHFDRGHVLNPRLSEYRVPRFSDLPSVEVHLLDRKDLPPAGGGETVMIAVAPAIANALFDATGLRVRSLPLLVDGKVPAAVAGAPRPSPGPATKATKAGPRPRSASRRRAGPRRDLEE